jgi:arginine 2-monooxygenase
LQHCLIPQPKIVLIDKDENGKLTSRLFMEQQKADEMLKILGY